MFSDLFPNFSGYWGNFMGEQKTKASRASITAEAALVFPIFFFALLVFLYFFQLMLIQLEVQKSLFNTASFSAQYAYFTEEFLKGERDAVESGKDSWGYSGRLSEFSEGVMNKALAKVKFDSFADKNFLEHSCIVNHLPGISLLESEFLENGNDIDIIAVYKIKFPLPFFERFSFSVRQRVKTKAFLGKSMLEEENPKQDNSGDEDDKVVYITETGTVYHSSRECTYLNPSIRQVDFTLLDTVRNSGGAKYVKCDSCCRKKEVYDHVYITTWGTGYHSQLDCRGLKRTIMEESRSEAEEQGYRACSKCGGVCN